MGEDVVAILIHATTSTQTNEQEELPDLEETTQKYANQRGE